MGNDKIVLSDGLDRQRPAKIDSLGRCLGDDNVRLRTTMRWMWRANGSDDRGF
jgi:hypothetical protein